MLRLSTFPNVVIVGTSSLPICRFCKPGGLPESTLLQPETSPFTLRGIQVQKPLCGSRITSLRKEVGPAGRPRRYYPPVSAESKRKSRRAVSSRQATWLVLRRPQDLSLEDQHALELVMQAHAQLEVACKLAQSFALMVREKKVSALEPWLQEASRSGIAELRTFATGIKRDQAAVQAALTSSWSQGQVEGQVHRLKLLKRQSYGRAGFELLRHRVLARSA